ncbi:MAG TPA: carboxymuconolactone decarboxylase family protein [Acidimicrobiia bacterium]
MDTDSDSNIGTEAELEVRIQPGAPGALGPLGRVAAWIGGRATHGDPPRVLTTLARHRRLFRRWLPFGAGLLRGTELPREDVELVILRTAWNCASWYEWAQHVALAAAAGLDPSTPVRVMEGAGADGWSPRQRALLLGTDELHAHQVISDGTWKVLAEELGELELLELCFVVGHYVMLAMALNSLGVEPEPTTLDRLEAHPAAAANTLHQTLAARRRDTSSHG